MNKSKEPLVSVIVPVYNVDQYLEKSVDSLLAQTYKNLEILLIDDGSTDESGKICDKYAELDSRIRSFHKKNGGLSSARNYGLERMNGEWISFVDSDDYIDKNMINDLICKALENECDIAECGIYDVYPNKVVVRKMNDKEEVYEQSSIMKAHIVNKSIENAVWNKLYRSKLYKEIRFKEDRHYEDIEITHKVLNIANKVIVIPECYYYYIQREGSISKTYKLKPLVDYWKGCYEKYEAYHMLGDEYKKVLIESCVHSSGTVWLWMKRNEEEEKKWYNKEIEGMNAFIKNNYEYIKSIDLPAKYKMMAFFVKHNNNISFSIIYYLGCLHRMVSGSDFYSY